MSLQSGWVAGPVVGALLALLSVGAGAQEDVFELRDRCAGGSPVLEPRCLEAALAAQAVQGAMTLVLAGGSDHPGTPSTLGRRIGASPRIGLSLRAAGIWSRAPDVIRDAELPIREEGFFSGALEGRVVVGAFQGFSLLPTVGGVLSLDLQASAGITFLPSDFGFRDNGGGIGLGARVGLFRESFTLPGVSVSAAHRWMSEVRLRRLTGSEEGIEVVVDPSATSIRAVAGKDLMAVSLLAGIGWDRYSGAARISANPDAPGEGAMDGFTSDRMLYFGSLSITYLVLQIGAEVGWTGGYFELPDRSADLYDPGEGAFFASVGLRLTI